MPGTRARTAVDRPHGFGELRSTVGDPRELDRVGFNDVCLNRTARLNSCYQARSARALTGILRTLLGTTSREPEMALGWSSACAVWRAGGFGPVSFCSTSRAFAIGGVHQSAARSATVRVASSHHRGRHRSHLATTSSPRLTTATLWCGRGLGSPPWYGSYSDVELPRIQVAMATTSEDEEKKRVLVKQRAPESSLLYK